jgi:hypothetical protein
MEGKGQVMADMSRRLPCFLVSRGRIVVLFLFGGIPVEAANGSTFANTKYHTVMLSSP